MNAARYDAVVVGARVAGAATALLLARSGRRVALLDRSRYGTDTISTHGLLRGAVLQLARWGVLDAVTAAGTPPIRRVDFCYRGADPITVAIRPGDGVDALYAPRRHLLDRVLVDAADRAGVDIDFGVTVTRLLRGWDGAVRGVAGVDGRGRAFERRAELTVGADGVRSRVAAEVDAPALWLGSACSAVLYRYYEGLPATGFQWCYGDASAAGVLPTNDGQTCVFVGCPRPRMRALRSGGAESAMVALLAAAAPELSGRIRQARPAGPIHGWRGMPGYLRRAVGPGWALVGDAGYYKDPITAHGITDALRDAELLARAVVDSASTGGYATAMSEANPMSERQRANRGHGRGTPTRSEANPMSERQRANRGHGRGTPTRSEANPTRSYQEVRDRLSRRLFDGTEAIARYDWDIPTLTGLVREVSAATADEVDHLSALDEHPPVPGGAGR